MASFTSGDLPMADYQIAEDDRFCGYRNRTFLSLHGYPTLPYPCNQTMETEHSIANGLPTNQPLAIRSIKDIFTQDGKYTLFASVQRT